MFNVDRRSKCKGELLCRFKTQNMVVSGNVKNAVHGVKLKQQDVSGVVNQNHQEYHSMTHLKHKRNKTKTKTKRIKATSIPVIVRRLLKLASLKCRERAKMRCEICGMQKGEIHQNTGNVQKVEAHHVMSRSNKDSSLKFDLRNMVCLCTEHHKTGKYSAHKHGLWFAQEFTKIRPKDSEWILKHSDDCVNLKDRNILDYIEKCLKANKPLNFSTNNQPEQLEFEFLNK